MRDCAVVSPSRLPKLAGVFDMDGRLLDTEIRWHRA